MENQKLEYTTIYELSLPEGLTDQQVDVKDLSMNIKNDKPTVFKLKGNYKDDYMTITFYPGHRYNKNNFDIYFTYYQNKQPYNNKLKASEFFKFTKSKQKTFGVVLMKYITVLFKEQIDEWAKTVSKNNKDWWQEQEQQKLKIAFEDSD
jgi:hypothetical protein